MYLRMCDAGCDLWLCKTLLTPLANKLLILENTNYHLIALEILSYDWFVGVCDIQYTECVLRSHVFMENILVCSKLFHEVPVCVDVL